GGDVDGDVLRPPGNRRRHDQRRRQVAVGCAVVLGQHHAVEPEVVPPRALLEAGAVPLASIVGCARGDAQLVSQEHHRHGGEASDYRGCCAPWFSTKRRLAWRCTVEANTVDTIIAMPRNSMTM